ncbi:procathepsin L-like [Cydia strobilella]|uniref:procathepsin L-like n=1 Tax=Cydia strobilella TaxID=1100964 RepID=UPI003005766C
MKCAFLLVFVMASAMAVFLDDLKSFGNFKLEHKKRYKSAVEEVRRLQIYVQNQLKIMQHNMRFEQGLVSYKLKLNQYSDLDDDEFEHNMYGVLPDIDDNFIQHEPAFNLRMSSFANLPDYVDWRERGAVTAVKTQGHCGSCWAFSATGALEGQVFIKTNRLISLSEQNLIDCTSNYRCRGCGGGWMNNAFQYIKDNGGINTEASYPYEANNGQCRYDPMNLGATNKGYVKIPRDENKLKEAVATIGPISATINSLPSIHHYGDGVYYEKDCNPNKHNHAVLVVGYGTDANGGDYWIVKNSWGKRWGRNGYIKMARNRDNNCGIASSASYPLV